MKHLFIPLLILLLASACSQSRYGHLTVRSQEKRSSGHIAHRSKVKIDEAERTGLHSNRLESIQIDVAPSSVPVRSVEFTRPETKAKHASNGKWKPLVHEMEVIEVVKTVAKSQTIKARSPEEQNSLLRDIWNALVTAVVFFLFCAAIAWVISLFGIPFWTAMLWMGYLVAFILLMSLLGLGEVWMGR